MQTLSPNSIIVRKGICNEGKYEIHKRNTTPENIAYTALFEFENGNKRSAFLCSRAEAESFIDNIIFNFLT